MQPPPPPGAHHGQQAFGQPPAARRRGPRLGLILGISIPVAMLVIGGIVAAIVVPGVLTDQDAQSAADEYAQERSEWASVFSDDALQPYAQFDTTAFDGALLALASRVGSGSYGTTSADPASFQSACDAFADQEAQAATLTAPPPALRVVEGGDRNDAYAQAVADAAASQTAYDASATFTTDVAASFDAFAGGCALVLAQAEAHTAFVAANDALLASATVPMNGTERYDIDASSGIEFTCLSENGCPSFVDRAARAAYGNAWDAAFVVYNQAMAESYRDHCPAADVQAACDAWATMHDQSVQLAAAVGQAYRDEDVTGGAAFGGDTTPAPDLSAARNAYVAGEQANIDTALAASEDATGSRTMFQIIDDIVLGEGQAIRDAASAILG